MMTALNPIKPSITSSDIVKKNHSEAVEAFAELKGETAKMADVLRLARVIMKYSEARISVLEARDLITRFLIYGILLMQITNNNRVWELLL